MESATTMEKNYSKYLYYFSTFDGTLEMTGNNARLRITMIEDSIEYLIHVSTLLDQMGISSTISPKSNTTGFKNSKPQFILGTVRHPKLTKVWKRIYQYGRKVIDPHMLTLLDAEALAIIFMCDGSGSYANKKPQYYLHTNSFSYAENLLLKQTIKKQLNLEFNVVKNKKWYELRLARTSAERFVMLIEPFVLDCFKYKLKVESERLTPEMGDDIVCSAGQLAESGRNDQASRIAATKIVINK